MNIHIDQIREDEGLTVNHHYPDGEPGLRGEDSRLVGRPVLNAKATREGGKVRMVGHLNATVQIECDRCLTPLNIPIDQSFDLLYIPPVRAGAAQEEHELGDDDLRIAFYQDKVIDIDDLVREQIELTLPMLRLCSEDCRGLCAQCGANRNQGACDCTFDHTDNRWAALKILKSDN